MLVGLSDDGLAVPGIRARLELDALLGTLLPGAGDALYGVTAAMLMLRGGAWRRGAPALLYEMLGNVARAPPPRLTSPRAAGSDAANGSR